MANFQKKQTNNATSLQAQMNQLFNSFFTDSYDYPSATQNNMTNTPAINIAETANEVIVTAELPGVAKNNLDVTVDNNKLVIKGEKTASTQCTEGDYVVKEASYGTFQRTVNLGNTAIDISKAKSTYKQGVLQVTLPKKAEAIQNTKKLTVTEEK